MDRHGWGDSGFARGEPGPRRIFYPPQRRKAGRLMANRLTNAACRGQAATKGARRVADLEYTVENGFGTILLNRPEKKNAFTVEMVDRWAEVLVGARADDSVSAIIVTGAGDAFCAGGDFGGLSPDAEREPGPYERKAFLTDHVHRVAYALEDLDKPVIAAVNGVAVGAGLDFAMMCDMRFAARSARMSGGYIKVGLVPGDGGCYWLPPLVGPAKALDLLLTGDFVDTGEAHRIGLVNRVYDEEL